jgi:uncharacterized membrane protein YvbJ
MEIKNEKKPVSRKKFLFWTIGSLSVFTAAKYFFHRGSKSNTRTVKMLTQSGKLVEVDVTNLACGKRKKISDDELKNWVKNK